jgi:hypothetical protein
MLRAGSTAMLTSSSVANQSGNAAAEPRRLILPEPTVVAKLLSQAEGWGQQSGRDG